MYGFAGDLMKFIYISLTGIGLSILGITISSDERIDTAFGGLFIISMLALWIFAFGRLARKLRK